MERSTQVNRGCSQLGPAISRGCRHAGDVDLPALIGEASDTRKQRGITPAVPFLNS